MLKEFTMKNYKSFKDEMIFTMEADIDNVSEHPDHLIKNKYSDNLLKLGSIYGPNGGGKTTIIKGLMLMKNLIAPRQIELLREVRINFNDIESFKFSSKKTDKIIEMSGFFIDDKYEIGYKFSFEKLKIEEGYAIRFNKENLSFRDLATKEFINLFTRNGQIIESELLRKELNVSTFLVSDAISFVAFLENNHINRSSKNTKYLDIVSRLLKEIRLISYFRGLDTIQTERNYEQNSFLSMYLGSKYRDNNIKDKVVNILNNLDINISDIIIEKTSDGRRKVYCEHFVDDKKFRLSLEEESEGTIGLINMLPSIIRIIETGGIMIVDELDAHLHPKLIKRIIELFGSKINRNAQLIFNSHDIWNMTNENFRRDEIWFVYRTNELASELVCLSDYINYKGEKVKVRKDAKFSKQYMEGKYGADPFISKGVLWNA